MSDEERVTCGCGHCTSRVVMGGGLVEWVEGRGGAVAQKSLVAALPETTHPAVGYCSSCGARLSFDAEGKPVAQATVPRAALAFAVCCELSGEPWTREEAMQAGQAALAAAGGGDGEV